MLEKKDDASRISQDKTRIAPSFSEPTQIMRNIDTLLSVPRALEIYKTKPSRSGGYDPWGWDFSPFETATSAVGFFHPMDACFVSPQLSYFYIQSSFVNL